jgi:C4-dicarboxylate transporter DctQ subunit
VLRTSYDAVIKTAAFIAFTAMLIAALIGTVTRYLTFLPVVTWGEEVTRFAGIWSVFLVSGLGIRHGTHLGVDMVTRLMRPGLRLAVHLAVYALMLAFCVLLLVAGCRLVLENMDQLSPALEWPMGALYACIPLGAVLMSIEIVPIMAGLAHGRPAPRPAPDEVVE